MVDQSFIDELKRRNAERAEKLKRDLDIGDLSKLDPGNPSPEPEVFRETSSSEPPPPPASSAAAMPPPPPAGIGGSGSGAPPPPPSATPRSSAAPPPPPPTIAKQAAPSPAPSMDSASDRFDEPIAPSTGIWDEILGGVTKDAQELEQKRGGAEEFAVPTLDEAAEEPITSGDEPPTGDTSDFIVPKFGSSPGDKPATSEVAAPLAPSVEPEPISVGEDAPTGDTDEFLVPSFASTPGSETPVVLATPATPEPTSVAEPVAISVGEDALAEDDDEFVVPKFGSAPAVAEAPEPVPSAATEQPDAEEFVVPTFDSAPAEEPVLPVAVASDGEVPSFGADAEPSTTEQPADEGFVVPVFDSTPAEEPVLPVAVASETEIPSPGATPVEELPVIEQVIEKIPVVEPVDFIQPVSAAAPVPTTPAKPATREPVTAEKEPDDADIHRIVLEISGAELRLKRLNISLREAINLLEIAAEECRKLLE